jgi:hypothetical protein
MSFPFIKSEAAAKNLEPMLCLVLGGFLTSISPTLGLFLCGGAVSLTVLRCMEREGIRRQVIAMRDLQIEQQVFSERVRNVRDDF